jgi:hypothetical protein
MGMQMFQTSFAMIQNRIREGLGTSNIGVQSPMWKLLRRARLAQFSRWTNLIFICSNLTLLLQCDNSEITIKWLILKNMILVPFLQHYYSCIIILRFLSHRNKYTGVLSVQCVLAIIWLQLQLHCTPSLYNFAYLTEKAIKASRTWLASDSAISTLKPTLTAYSAPVAMSSLHHIRTHWLPNNREGCKTQTCNSLPTETCWKPIEQHWNKIEF